MLFCGFFLDYSTSIGLSCNESSLDFLMVMLEETDSTCAIPYIYIYKEEEMTTLELLESDLISIFKYNQGFIFQAG